MKEKRFINLYSKDLTTKKWPSDKNFLITFWGSLALIVGFVIYYGYNVSVYVREYHKNKELSEKYNVLNLKDKELAVLSYKLRDINEQSKALSLTVKELDKLFSKKIKWTEFLKDFSSKLNEHVWIDRLTVAPVGDAVNLLYVQIQGGAISLKDLNRFVEEIEKAHKNVKVSFKVVQNKGVTFYSFAMNFTWNRELSK